MKSSKSAVLTIVVAALGYGGSSMAGIMYFENPAPGEEGHFNWHVNLPDTEETFEQWLNITKPSTDQFELRNGSSVGQLFRDNGGDSANITIGGALVAYGPGQADGSTRAFQFGDEIAQADFSDLTYHVYSEGSGLESQFPEGELRYIGVLTEGGNYGWIAVMRDGLTLRTTGWAYQTEPGVPIRAGEIPGVGGIAFFGLFGLTSRRRRIA